MSNIIAGHMANQIEIPKAFESEFIDFVKSYIDIFHRIPVAVKDNKFEKRYSEDQKEFTSFVGFNGGSLAFSIRTSKLKNDEGLIYFRTLNYSSEYSNKFVIDRPECFNNLMEIIVEIYNLEQKAFAKSIAFKLDMKMM